MGRNKARDLMKMFIKWVVEIFTQCKSTHKWQRMQTRIIMLLQIVHIYRLECRRKQEGLLILICNCSGQMETMRMHMKNDSIHIITSHKTFQTINQSLRLTLINVLNVMDLCTKATKWVIHFMIIKST